MPIFKHSSFKSQRGLIARVFALLSLAGLLAAGSSFARAGTQPTEPPPAGYASAIFAGGCFWCMEKPFDQLDGVISTTSGYTDGPEANPSYKRVARGLTGHTEAVEIIYDPAIISYEKLLEVFWVNIDPTTKNRQFCDAGTQYRSGIYTHNAAEQKAAEASRIAVLERFGKVYTEIKPASTFYAAEAYHQDYYLKNPIRYRYYRNGCGRDKRLKALWGDRAGGKQ